MTVTTWYPASGYWPKHHTDECCDGLEMVPEAVRDTMVHASELALLRHGDGRPCRRCTLEPAVVAAARGRWLWQHGTVHVTFSGQGVPGEPGSWQWRDPYRWGEVSDSGAARLERIAALVGVAVVHTSWGPVACGTTTERWATVLERNLRLYRTGESAGGDAAVDPLAVEAFWAMANTSPSEQGGALGPAAAWKVAAGIVR